MAGPRSTPRSLLTSRIPRSKPPSLPGFLVQLCAEQKDSGTEAATRGKSRNENYSR